MSAADEMPTLDSFYPKGIVKCESDLTFADGTYEVWERDVILNIFEIKNKRIIYHYKYNTEMKLRLITWHFEYLTAKDGTQICNIWRQPTRTGEQDLFHSTHWQLYPEHFAIHLKQKQQVETFWNKFDEKLTDTGCD